MSDTVYPVRPGHVYFIGAGPGAPDLITLRGRDIIAQADLVVYADSLVDERIVAPARARGARIVGSARLALEDILEEMVRAARRGAVVARVHSGDPAIYGAVHEQIVHLEAEGIPYEIVPGVPSAFAAAARLGVELTVPNLVQTVIFTRTAGRTPMPPGEALRDLATHQATLAIHLSVTRITRVVEALLAGGYPPDTPVAVIYKVTWPDEQVLRGTLEDIAGRVRQAGFTRHAIILVGAALDARRTEPARRSRLYDRSHTHRFRPLRESARPLIGRPPTPQARAETAVIALTRNGSRIGASLAVRLRAELAVPEKFAGVEGVKGVPVTLHPFRHSVLQEVRQRWHQHRRLVLVMPTGVAVRAVAPLLHHKSKDPAVICLDETGRWVIPLVGGHQAGANALAREIARYTGGAAAVTTASDVQGLPALDLLGREAGWRIAENSALTQASAALVNGEPVGLFVDPELPASVHAQVEAAFRDVPNVAPVAALADLSDAFDAALVVTHRRLTGTLAPTTVTYHPPVLYVGMGCRRGVPATELRRALETACKEAGLSLESIAALVTADVKREEPGLQALAEQLGVPLRVVSSDTLRNLPTGAFTPSAAQEHFDVPGVAEPAALVASAGRIILPKRVFPRCTVAIAIGEGRDE